MATTSTNTFKIRLRKTGPTNASVSSNLKTSSSSSSLSSADTANNILTSNHSAISTNSNHSVGNNTIEKQQLVGSTIPFSKNSEKSQPNSTPSANSVNNILKKFKISLTPKLKQNNANSYKSSVDSIITNNMNYQFGSVKNTDEMTLNSSNLTKNSFCNTSTNGTTSNYNYRTSNQESLELKRQVQLINEKFQKFTMKGVVELDEQYDIEEAEETIATTKNKDSDFIESSDSQIEDSQCDDPKVVRAFSADESVVEVLKESFQPQFVNDINFEIFKLPNSQQKTNCKLVLSKVRLTAKNSTLKKKSVIESDASVGSQSQSSNSKHLKPINLDLHLASAVDSKNNNFNFASNNNKKLVVSDDNISANSENSKLNCSEHSKSCNSLSTIVENDPSSSTSDNGKTGEGTQKKTNNIRRNNSLELKSLNPILLSSTGRKLSSVENIVRASSNNNNKSVKNNQLVDNNLNKVKSTFSSQSVTPASSFNKKVNNNKNGSKVSEQNSIRNIHVNKKCYQILNKIGRGGSSTVYQVYDLELKSTLALKVVDLSKADESIRIGFKNEINLLSKLRHCNRVVRMYDYEFRNSNRELLIVMEKGDNDLSNVFKSYCETEKKFSPDFHLIRFYWQEMLKVVQEIHKFNVVHSDLKPVNFILVSGKLKLIDFGIANAIQSNKTSIYKDCIIGTVDYMAPESFQKNVKHDGKSMVKFNQKSDIWSLGIILFNLVFGFTPFSHIKDNFKKSCAISNSNIEYPEIDDPLLLDVIKQCLQRDPNKRPTTGELLSHKYLTQSSDSSKDSTPSSSQSNSEAPGLNIHPELISQINNLTPNTLRCLSKVIESFSKK